MEPDSLSVPAGNKLLPWTGLKEVRCRLLAPN